MCSTQSSVPYGVVRIRKWATHALNGLEKSPHSTTVHIGKFNILRVAKSPACWRNWTKPIRMSVVLTRLRISTYIFFQDTMLAYMRPYCIIFKSQNQSWTFNNPPTKCAVVRFMVGSKQSC